MNDSQIQLKAAIPSTTICGIDRKYVALVTHVFSIILTRQFVGNVDPVGKILDYNTNGSEAFATFKQWSNSAFSFSMIAFPLVSYVGDSLGPRKMAALSMLTYCVGMLLATGFTNAFVIRLGLTLLGLGFGACITAYYPLYLEFPKNTGFIVGAFGGASDISLFVPIFVSLMYEKLGIPVFTTTSNIVIFALLLAAVNWLLIPKNGWTQPARNMTDPTLASPTSKVGDLEMKKNLEVPLVPHSDHSRQLRRAPTTVARSGKTKLTDILTDRVYMYFIVWFLAHTVRIKKHFMPYYRNLFTETAPAKMAESLTDVISICASLGFISSLITGYCVDRFGSDKVVLAITTLGFIFFSGLSILPPWMHYYVSTVLFISQTGSCFGLYSVLISKHESQKFFGSLQAFAYIIFGAICYLFDIIWTPSVIETYFGTFRKANMFVTVISTAIQCAMLALMVIETRKHPRQYLFAHVSA